MKHAFLIMAHTDFSILGKLVVLLDHPDNSIFIHFDRKISNPPCFETTYSSIYYIPDESRIHVSWGGWSIVKCTLQLIEFASNKGKYDYYHLLSGVDLPIQTNKYIHNFFEQNKGKEFIGFQDITKPSPSFDENIKLYHLFETDTRKRNKILNILHKSLIKIQKLSRFYKKIDTSFFRRGAEWFSITENLAKELISCKDDIIKRYKHTHCSDEVFLQTFVFNNSKYRLNLYNTDCEFEGCMREIDWKRGAPYVWTNSEEDLIILNSSNKLFARKFNSKHSTIVEFLYDKLSNLNVEYAKESNS